MILESYMDIKTGQFHYRIRTRKTRDIISTSEGFKSKKIRDRHFWKIAHKCRPCKVEFS